MDHPNLNMSQHNWLDMVKDYDCEILYHPGKSNIMADALSRKVMTEPIGDLYMRMVIISPLLELINNAQVEGLKKEN